METRTRVVNRPSVYRSLSFILIPLVSICDCVWFTLPRLSFRFAHSFLTHFNRLCLPPSCASLRLALRCWYLLTLITLPSSLPSSVWSQSVSERQRTKGRMEVKGGRGKGHREKHKSQDLETDGFLMSCPYLFCIRLFNLWQ